MSVTTIGGHGPLVPHDMNGAMQLAAMMAKGKLVPQHLRDSPGDCLMVIEQAIRWNMSPFAVAQCTSVIQGKLMFEGKLVSAALHTSGIMERRLHEEFGGSGDTRCVTLTGTIRGETTPRVITVTLKEAKTSNGMWTKQPDQQLIYFATRAWARRHAPEVMLGVYSPEEFDETKDRFSGTTIDIRPDPELVMQPAPPPPKATRTWGDFLSELDAELANAQTAEEVDEILARSTVQQAQDKLQNGAKDRLTHMIQQAIHRTLASETSAPNDEIYNAT